jgi:pentatricopeptide repeat protein
MNITRFARTRSNGAVNYTSRSGSIPFDQLRQIAPSVFAEQAHGSRSEKYSYIPTSEILSGLARAHAPPLLDKAFAYLGKMRTLSPEDLGDGVVPSALARNNLIRTCAVVIRGVGLDGMEGGGHHQQQHQQHSSLSRARSQAIYSHADSKKYVNLGEMLFDEYLQSAHEAIRRQPTNQALLRTYQTDTPPLLSSTIYLYCQAREHSKAIALFQRMREQSFPCSIIPDAWAASGVIRAQAHHSGPLEAWSLLQDLTKGPTPIEVILLPGLYKSLAHCIQRQLAQGRHPVPQAQELRRLAHRVLTHMRGVGKLQPPLTLWRVLMKIETRFGDWRRVQRYMAMMKEDGWVCGCHEYAMLIEALGEGKALGVLAQTQAKMREEGVPFTYVVYLSIIQAHRKSYDLRGAQAAFEALLKESLPAGGGVGGEEVARRANPMEVVTTMMKVYAQAGLPQKAWDLFCQFREGKVGGRDGREGGRVGRGLPDHMM